MVRGKLMSLLETGCHTYRWVHDVISVDRDLSLVWS